MHDDVHKKKARLMLPVESFERFHEFSNLLYAADGIAQGIRNTVEGARISEVSDIKRVEAINQAMFFMVNFLAQPRQTTLFNAITRVDEYVIDRNEPHFRFEVNGSSTTPQFFSMLLGGDTPNINFRLVRFECDGKRITTKQFKLDKGLDFGNTVLLHRLNSKTGHSGTATPQKSFTRAGRPCRLIEFTNAADGLTGRSEFTFCKQPDGAWKIPS